jgi:HlyD family secretion protein
MENNSSIFRKQAVENFIPREELTELIENSVTYKWYKLIFIVFIFSAFTIWLFLFDIDIIVFGQGIIHFENGKVFNIVNYKNSIIKEYKVNSGTIVKKNQVLAELLIPELEIEIQNHKRQLIKLKEEELRVVEFIKQNQQQINNYLNESIHNLTELISYSEQQKNYFTKKLLNQKVLFKKGFITHEQIEETEIKILNLKNQILRSHSEMQSVKHINNLKNDELYTKIHEIKANIILVENSLEKLEFEFTKSKNLLAPISGIINEIKISTGELIPSGSKVMTLISGSSLNTYEVLSYIPLDQGKKVKVGMPAIIIPSTINYEEHGAIKGVVKFVSSMPVSYQKIINKTGDNKLANNFETQPVLEVLISLEKDNRNGLLYLWTNNNPPNISLEYGTLVNVKVNIETKKPYQLFLPLFKKIYS